MEATQTTVTPAIVPKTKKVRMPDGTIKTKVQQADGSWKWSKNSTKQAPAIVIASPAFNEFAQGAEPKSAEPVTALLSSANVSLPERISGDGNAKQKTDQSRATKKKQPSHVKLGRLFKVAGVLDAVLPEHLKIGHELAEDLGVHDSDRDDTSSDSDAQVPTKSSSKQLAKLAASGVKVKTQKAKKAVFRPGETGSSDEDDHSIIDLYAEKMPANPSDDVATMNEKTSTTKETVTKKDTTIVVEQEIRPLKKRSSTGRRLRRRTSRLAQGVAWAIALMFPLLFLALAIFNASMNGLQAGKTGSYHILGPRLQEANKICVSMWPILFGAIVAQSLKMYASWRMEHRGMALVNLEQFIGSHSLASAVKQPFFLNHINLTGIGMICLWALSPITGQSFLRILTQTTYDVSSPANISYPNFSRANVFDMLPDGGGGNVQSYQTNSLNQFFATALLTTPLKQGVDIWSNFLVPYNDTLTDSTSLDGGDLAYVSYVGLPMLNITANSMAAYSNITVTLPFSFLALRCPNSVNTTIDEINEQTNYPDIVAEYGGEGVYKLHADAGNNTWMAAIPPPSYFAPIDLNATAIQEAQNNNTWPGYPIVNKTDIDAGTILFAINHTSTNISNSFDTQVDFWNCSYYTQYLDVTVERINDNYDCNATRTERKPNLGSHYLSNRFVEDFLSSLGTAGVSADGHAWADASEDLSGLALAMIGQSGGLAGFTTTDESAKSSLNYGDAMAKTLGKFINTYYEITFTSDILASKNPLYESASYEILGSTIGTQVDGFAVYKVHWEWFGVLVFSCLLLLAFGITGIILDSRTIGPDILGFASSLTRDNRYIKLDDNDVEQGVASSSKNAYETMNDMKHHRVMLMDVRGHEEVGKIALASVGLLHGKPLSKDKLYR